MNSMLRRLPGLALVASVLACGAELALGQVQVFVDGQMRLARPVDGMANPGEVTNAGIGDPWWDEAEAQAKATPPGGVRDATVEQDRADAADPRAIVEMRAELIRRNLEQQGLGILRRELSIVREACPALEPDERAVVVQAGRAAIAQLSEGRSAEALRLRRERNPDYERAVAAALRASLATVAGPMAAADYERERGLRQERAKQATIAALVAEVDRDADLEAAEREALSKALGDSYREPWRQAVAQAGQRVAADVLPQGLDRCVEEALGEERKAEWLARREAARRLMEGAGGQGVQIMGDAVWVDVPVQIPDAAAGQAIKRRIINNGGGLRLQIELRQGGEDAAADQEP